MMTKMQKLEDKLNKIYTTEECKEILKDYNHIFFSVIIPCYNCENTIRRLMESLTRQDFSNFEVLICDDRSTDNFMLIVNEFRDKLNIRYLRTEKNELHGPSVARNLGLDNAKGDWVLFIDSDDFLNDNILRDFYQIISENDYELLFTNVKTLDFNSNDIGTLYSWVNLHGKCFKYSLIKDIRFNKFIYMNEDLYFLNTLQIYNKNIKIYYNQDLFSYFYCCTKSSIVHSTSYFYSKCLHDFILARYEPFYLAYKEDMCSKDTAIRQMVYAFFAGYSFHQGHLFKTLNHNFDNEIFNITNIKNIFAFKLLITRLKELGLSNDEIKDNLLGNHKIYKEAVRDYECWTGKFIEVLPISKLLDNIIE